MSYIDLSKFLLFTTTSITQINYQVRKRKIRKKMLGCSKDKCAARLSRLYRNKIQKPGYPSFPLENH